MINIPDGAVDLSKLKGPNEHEMKLIRANRSKLLRQNNLVCPCGANITTDGVRLHVLQEGMIETAKGREPGVQIGSASFHSRECIALAQILANPVKPGEAYPLVIEKLPAYEWLPAPPFVQQ